LQAGPKNPGTKGRIAGPGRGKKNGSSILELPLSDVPTFAESGIDRKLASRAQAIAATPSREFEAAIADDDDKELNHNRIAKELADKIKKQKRDDDRSAAAKSSPKLDSRVLVGDFRSHFDKIADGSLGGRR
jgi:dephospho-CoA kinase